MKITSLSVRNFRALTNLELRELGDSVVVAGPNGCGKSCALDAIRLLKSAYGGYGPNEWQNWFGEFQINLNKSAAELLTLFQNRAQPLSVRMEISLDFQEQEYLRDNVEVLVRDKIREQADSSRRGSPRIGMSLAADHRARQPGVERRVAELRTTILATLERASHIAEVIIQPGREPVATDSPLLELVFSVYEPNHIGIIDFHGANRNYNREQLGGINLNIESSENRMRQHALYNYANKYQNLKSEMAASYVRHLLAKQADHTLHYDDSLTDILKELFTTFFPGKEFLGPRPTPDGRLLFPVRTPSGAEHDIDELSSGEKEVLYGYLRLRNSAPRNSVILIDEPELHLNPRLISGLASFYHRHLGRSLNNQLWLVTHSDTLIRESVSQRGFRVFHLQPAGTDNARNQATAIAARDELDRCVIDLVGDMAAYRPGAKLVLCEGGGDADFDVRMTLSLFPGFAQRVNMLSGGSKRRVTDLYDLLEEARTAGHVPARVYLITDSDGGIPGPTVPRQWSWPAYHIENYLLEPTFIRRVLDDIAANRNELRSEQEIETALRECAAETIPDLVAHELRRKCNEELVGCIDLGFDPNRQDTARAVHEAVLRSQRRVAMASAERLTSDVLTEWAQQATAEATASLRTDDWRTRLRGRQILRRFVARTRTGLNYETFRDLVLGRMSDSDYQPLGMAKIIHTILSD
jgi:predicted ATPase